MDFVSIFTALINTYGLWALFAISLIASASILFPVPSEVAVFLMGVAANPITIALVASTGSAIGELTVYGLGIGSEKILQKARKKTPKWIGDLDSAFKKYGFGLLFLFAATPLPFDAVGVVAGITKYKVERFLIATWCGKMVKNIVIAYAGAMGLGFVLNIFY